MQTSDRKITVPRAALQEHQALTGLKVDSMLVSDRSFGSGRTAIELDLRRRTRALIVAIRRGEVLLEEPDPAEPLTPGDVVYLVGSNDSIRAAIDLLDGGPADAS